MDAEAIPQVFVHNSDLAKLTKPKPPILTPSIENKLISPNANTKISLHSPNQKNYVTVRKFNSTFATVGLSQNGQKLSPKMQSIQQAVLSNLPEKFSSIPPYPKIKHRRTESQSKNFESKQIESVKSNDPENSLSKLITYDTDYSIDQNKQVNEDVSNDSLSSNSDSNLLKNNNRHRKRKCINCSSSFNISHQDGQSKIHSSYSYFDFQKKVSKSNTLSNNILYDDNLSQPQSYNGIRSVSSKISLTNHFSNDLKITIQFLSNWGNDKYLLLSTVTVLDERKKMIPIKTISSVPDLPKINLLERFTDQKLVKDDNDVFPIDFDASSNKIFSLILSVNKSSCPRFVRIWNPSLKDESLLSASFKNVTIYLDHKKVAEGEVTKNFGIDIEFDNNYLESEELKHYDSSLLIDELFPSLKPEEQTYDTFGVYPFHKSEAITIEVLSTYMNNTEKVEFMV